eukprot:Rhum_TRINITY_DN14927_c0_g1::Rhum_TRINITY_DN14927_c0_g1_i1::g.128623::m.128623
MRRHRHRRHPGADAEANLRAVLTRVAAEHGKKRCCGGRCGVGESLVGVPCLPDGGVLAVPAQHLEGVAEQHADVHEPKGSLGHVVGRAKRILEGQLGTRVPGRAERLRLRDVCAARNGDCEGLKVQGTCFESEHLQEAEQALARPVGHARRGRLEHGEVRLRLLRPLAAGGAGRGVCGVVGGRGGSGVVLGLAVAAGDAAAAGRLGLGLGLAFAGLALREQTGLFFVLDGVGGVALDLEVRNDHERQRVAAEAARVQFVDVAKLQDGLERDDERAGEWILFQESAHVAGGRRGARHVERDVGVHARDGVGESEKRHLRRRDEMSEEAVLLQHLRERGGLGGLYAAQGKVDVRRGQAQARAPRPEHLQGAGRVQLPRDACDPFRNLQTDPVLRLAQLHVSGKVPDLPVKHLLQHARCPLVQLRVARRRVLRRPGVLSGRVAAVLRTRRRAAVGRRGGWLGGRAACVRRACLGRRAGVARGRRGRLRRRRSLRVSGGRDDVLSVQFGVSFLRPVGEGRQGQGRRSGLRQHLLRLLGRRVLRARSGRGGAGSAGLPWNAALQVEALMPRLLVPAAARRSAWRSAHLTAAKPLTHLLTRRVHKISCGQSTASPVVVAV